MRPWAATTPQDIINYAPNIVGADASFRDTADEDLAEAEEKARQVLSRIYLEQEQHKMTLSLKRELEAASRARPRRPRS
eukprot:8179532-Lingulodinium_polyedra.AAC.1